MKRPILPSIVALICSNPSFVVQGVPFGTRGGKEDDDEKGVGSTSTSSIDVLGTVDTYTSTNHRSPIVESFFSSSPSSSEETSTKLLEEIRTKAQNMTNFLVSTRRRLHRHPELMYQEAGTSSVVREILNDLNINHTTGWAKNLHPEVFPGRGGYGVVADIGTGTAPCVVLRADMDALPILERTEGIDEFRSQNDGTMHACGHDGHTTMLLGATAILKSIEESIEGTVRVVFQPAEEGGAGAKRMTEEGVLDVQPKAERAFGLHVWPTIPSGTIAGRPGPILAAADRFEILISGVGGHAAMPHLTVDPIVTASAIVMNLQTIVSRTLSPLESGVCSITKFEAGDAFNVIPASAVLRGTVRALTTDTLISLREKVGHIVRTTAATHGCNVTITHSPDFYPPTVNDPELFPFASSVAGLVSSEGEIRHVEPTMGAEDFSFVAQRVPSAFFLLGQGSGKNPPTNYGLHHPHFALDESVMPTGVELHVNLALRALKDLATGPNTQEDVAAPQAS